MTQHVPMFRDTDFTDNPVCPYCAYIERDVSRMTFMAHELNNAKAECVCAECGKAYIVYLHRHVTYSTAPR